MVYCGRPSATCATCRTRKRRCDRAVPACGQCVRIGQPCPGYNDTSSHTFRNETTRVIAKARSQKHPRDANNAATKTSAQLTPNVSDTRSPTRTDVANSIRNSNSNNNHSHPGGDGTNDPRPQFPREQSMMDSLDPSPITSDARPDSNPDGVQAMVSDDFGGLDSWVLEEILAFMERADAVAPSTHSPMSIEGASPQALDVNALLSMEIPNPLSAPSGSLPDLGMNYFLTNYVLQASGPCPGFFNYTMHVLHDSASDRDLAQMAVQAVGLAGVANVTGANEIMRSARTNYLHVIEQVNKALSDQRLVKNDSTIFAVVVLSLFETITCSGDESLEAWRQHTNGVSNLLIQRGSSQFRTKVGAQIFGEAFSHVLTLCSRYGCPIPPRLRLLRVEMERSLPRKAPSWTLATIHIEVMSLFHRVDAEQQEVAFLPDEWETLLSDAVELDQRLEDLVANLPPEWQYRAVQDPSADPRIVYEGTYHIYYNPWVAKVWNGMRASRIILNHIIYCLVHREGQKWMPEETSTDEFGYITISRRVKDTMIKMRDDLLASVPQMLGFVQYDPATETWHSECTRAAHEIPRLTPASGAYFILWYLFLAGSLPINTPEIRTWVIDRLRTIRNATGIQKAEYFADMLEVGTCSIPSDIATDAFEMLVI